MVDTHTLKVEVYALCNDTIAWNTKQEYITLNNAAFTDAMSKKYNYLYTNSTTLFERCIIGDLNKQQLTFMLEMLEKVNNGADYHTASTEVGQRLVDIYVKPLIDNK